MQMDLYKTFLNSSFQNRSFKWAFKNIWNNSNNIYSHDEILTSEIIIYLRKGCKNKVLQPFLSGNSVANFKIFILLLSCACYAHPEVVFPFAVPFPELWL